MHCLYITSNHPATWVRADKINACHYSRLTFSAKSEENLHQGLQGRFTIQPNETMKRSFLIFLTVFSCLGAFAQGKVTIQNDDTHLVQFYGQGIWSLMAADASLTGQAVPTTGAFPSGVFLVAGLYAGTSVSSMTLVTAVPAGQTIPAVVPINSVAGSGLPPGWFTPTHAILPFEGGTLASMQVKVWEASYPSFEAQISSVGWFGGYLGESAIFTMTPGMSSKLTYPSIINGGGSTWTGPIYIGLIPEPGTCALGALGAAVVLIARRRK